MVDLSPYGKLTGPDIEVPIATTVYQQHFWSVGGMHDSLPRRDVIGDRLWDVFGTLFSDLFQSKLSRTRTLELYRQRIEIWNSDFPERATREDIEKLQAENATLFPPRIVNMTVLEPYLQYKAFVNRRAGAYSEYEVYCDHFAKPYGSDIHMWWENLSPYGKLTAPDIEVPVISTIYKHHIWSARGMGDAQEQALGWRMMEVFNVLFADLNMSHLPLAQNLELNQRRIEVWNSDFPERATRGDIEKLQAENALLFLSHVR